MGFILTKKGYILPNTKENARLLAPLHVTPAGDSGKPFRVYIRSENYLCVPKVFGIKTFGKAKETKGYLGSPPETPFSFKGSLRPEQTEALEKVLGKLHHDSATVFQAATGSGKTVIAIKAIAELQKKAIVLVNKVSLAEQWKAEIGSFLGVTVGEIRGAKRTLGDITIVSLQTLSRQTFPKGFFDEYGTVCLDEVHNIGSSVFSQALFGITSRYTLGLSATPVRADKLECVFFWHVGEIGCVLNAKEKTPPLIRTFKLNFDYTSFVRNGKIDYTSMITDLIQIKPRNEFIVKTVTELIESDPERRVLLVSERVSHLKTLHEMFSGTGANFTFGLFTGGTKKKDLQESLKCTLILATVSAFSEGVSEKDLNTLVLVTPKKFIGHLKSLKQESGKMEQLVGRIFRKEHTTLPMIIDLQDNFSIYTQQSRGRNVFYKMHFPNARFEHL